MNFLGYLRVLNTLRPSSTLPIVVSGCFMAMASVSLAGPAALAKGRIPGAPKPNATTQEEGPLTHAHHRVERLLKPNGMPWMWPLASEGAAPEAAGLAQTAMQGLRANDTQDRIRAVEACALLDETAMLDGLLPMLGDAHEDVRCAAADALQRATPNALAERLLRTLEYDQPPGEFLDTLPALEPVVGARVLEVFEAQDTPAPRREAAARLLGYLGSRAASEALQRATPNADADLAWACAEGMAELGDTSAVHYWISLLKHSDERVSGLAVETLGGFGDRAAFEALAAILPPNAGVPEKLRARAAEAIAQWPPALSGPVLVLLMESDGAFSDLALRLLRARTGRDSGSDPKAWRAWFEAGMPATNMNAAPAPAP